MAASLQTPFSNAIPWVKISVFWYKFSGAFPKGQVENKPAVVQVRRHDIAWTNDIPVNCRIHASPGPEELSGT